jgi:hypothetical protein
VNAERGICDWNIHSTKWSIVRLAEGHYRMEDAKDGNDLSTGSWIKEWQAYSEACIFRDFYEAEADFLA